MKALKSLIAVSTALLVAGVASAQCNATGCWGVYVEELYPEATGGVWIRTTGDETLANCTANSGVYLRIDPGVAGLKEIYATLLAAQLADRRVNIRIHEGSSQCNVAYVTLNRNTW